MNNLRWYIAASVLILGGIIFSSSLDVVRSGNLQLVSLGAPLASIGSKIKNFVITVKEIGQLKEKVVRLEKENIDLVAQLIDQTELKVQNEQLRKELELNVVEGYKPVAADVIAHGPLKILDQVIINKGSSRGLKAGYAVTSGGFLIGEVAEVSVTTSTVNLITSPKIFLAVILENSRSQGLLQGGINGMRVSDIRGDVEIKPGEKVLTSSLGTSIPALLPVGEIGEVISQEAEVLQAVVVNSPVKLTTVERVTVLVNDQN